MSSFSLFTVGYVIVVIGLAYAAYLVNVPREWIIVGLLVLAGLGVMKGVSKTKPRDPVER
jgi:hypothetical protein